MRNKIAVLVGVFVIGAACGRFSLPTKVIVKTQTIEVEKRVVTRDTTKQDNSVTVVTETKKPDGSIVTVTETKKDVHVDVLSKSKTDEAKHTDSEKETVYDRGRFTMSGLMLIGPLSAPGMPVSYGVDVSYRVLGPFSINALGATNGLVGVGLGVSF